MTRRPAKRPAARPPKKPRPARFLFPLTTPAILVQPADLGAVARLLARVPRKLRIPRSLAGSGLLPGGGFAPGPVLAIETPEHLRVSCILQEVGNLVVNPPGIGAPGENVVLSLNFASPIATSAASGYLVDVPAPGGTLTYAGAELVYDAVATGQCGRTEPVPLTVDAAISALENEITVFAPFDATDDTTLVPNGFWTFDFVIRASTIQHAGVSDFRIRGLVAIACTSLAAV